MSRSWAPRIRAKAAASPPSRWRRIADIGLAVSILGLLIVVAARFYGLGSMEIRGRPTINDGDSLTFSSQRIRLQGIDAPEFNQTCRRSGADYPCGRRAREALAGIVASGMVICTGWERDRYGRLLASCTAGGRDIGRMMVEAGWAVAYGDFADEEGVAREAGAGLWAGSFDRPRDWRQQHGGLAESEHDLFGRIVGWLRRALLLWEF